MSLIKVTTRALHQLKNILNEHNATYIYFGLKSGGCNVFEYIIKPTNNNREKNDELVEIGGVPIQICSKSLMFCLGTKIDWKKDVMGETFTFNNPMSKSVCGCGTSFTT